MCPDGAHTVCVCRGGIGEVVKNNLFVTHLSLTHMCDRNITILAYIENFNIFQFS